MRQKRDPFARLTLVPVRARGRDCHWCGQLDPTHPRANAPDNPCSIKRCYTVRTEPDAGRASETPHAFCSWACFRAFYPEVAA